MSKQPTIALTPGTNAMMNAFAHVVVTEGLVDEGFVRARCDIPSFKEWLLFASSPTNAPEAIATQVGVDAETIRAAAREYARRTERFTMVLASQSIPKVQHGDGHGEPARQPATSVEPVLASIFSEVRTTFKDL